mmetsp:Transcript_48906/g.66657  ORF Transcript_48906/g.66657 Transcript_48906/m.66657 type:complete len:293 (-) Transcript_48906:346-1224(-)
MTHCPIIPSPPGFIASRPAAARHRFVGSASSTSNGGMGSLVVEACGAALCVTLTVNVTVSPTHTRSSSSPSTALFTLAIVYPAPAKALRLSSEAPTGQVRARRCCPMVCKTTTVSYHLRWQTASKELDSTSVSITRQRVTRRFSRSPVALSGDDGRSRNVAARRASAGEGGSVSPRHHVFCRPSRRARPARPDNSATTSSGNSAASATTTGAVERQVNMAASSAVDVSSGARWRSNSVRCLRSVPDRTSIRTRKPTPIIAASKRLYGATAPSRRNAGSAIPMDVDCFPSGCP